MVRGSSYQKHRDSFGVDRARTCLVLGAVAVGLLASWELPVEACSTAAPGIFSRTVWPGSDQRPPTNTRLVVSYTLGARIGTEVPALGPDILLLDSDGLAVPISFEIIGSNVFIRPATALLPDHPYQIADRRSVPCSLIQGDCGLTPEPQIFASFTTASDTDTQPPSFAGLTSIAIGARQSCNNGGCCGPYDVQPIELWWLPGTDDVASGQLRYNVYRRTPGGTGLTPVATLVDGPMFGGFQTCSGQYFSTSELSPGSYVVRAVDWAGNEDENVIERHIGDLCASGGCSVARSANDARDRNEGSDWWMLGLSLITAAAAAKLAHLRTKVQVKNDPPT